jgi:hypothetical protein
MGLRSGLGAQIGFGKEETYGTYKAPSLFLPFESESLELQPGYQEDKALRAGQMFQSAKGHVQTTRTVSGDVNLKVYDQGMGIFFDLITGEAYEYKKIAETEESYEVTFKFGRSEPWNKSATIQVGRPQVSDGTVKPFSYLGCKLSGWTISVDTEGFMMLALTFAGRDEKTSETLGTVEYADVTPFHFGETEVLVKGEKVGSAQNVSVAGATPQPPRYRLGSAGLTSQPIPNDYSTCDITMTVDFEDTKAHTRFLEEEIVETKVKAVGPEIGEDGKNATIELTTKASKQVTSAPQVGGPDLVSESVTMKGLDDGTNTPVTVKLITSDSAI